MKHLVEGMVDFFIAKRIIESEWKAIYINGFTLLFSELINFALILLAGSVLGQFLDGAIFLLVFCVLRGFAGGYHAKKHWICRSVMLGSFTCVLLAKTVLQSKVLGIGGMLVLAMVAVGCLSIITKLAPVPHPNKPLTDKKRKINRRCACFFAFVCLIVSSLGILRGYSLGYMAFLAVVVVTVLMMIGKKKNTINKRFSGGTTNEKERGNEENRFKDNGGKCQSGIGSCCSLPRFGIQFWCLSGRRAE